MQTNYSLQLAKLVRYTFHANFCIRQKLMISADKAGKFISVLFARVIPVGNSLKYSQLAK